MRNRLSAEASPYLLQHADNPVDWYPWGQEAFEKARREDRPIFLSVGYSTCHWCHVMEHESFENGEIAGVLNDHFVSIKVDREERPDVDRVYMMFVQATTGAGGWPMSVWLTPELQPFFGGTYFPPTSQWGRPGFSEILREIARVWREEREKVCGSAQAIVDRLAAVQGQEPAHDATPSTVAGPDSLQEGIEQFKAVFDRSHGGFGGAPKFPRPSELFFLLRAYVRTGDEGARGMALATLLDMAQGGLRDHVGGGFHRYSVDAAWRVPHFEKMLYDQAQLVLAYLEAAQVTSEHERAFFFDIADDILAYVLRDMTDPSGGFFSAEDADSIPPEQVGEPDAHKSEGAYYIWRRDELSDLLGEDADVIRYRFGVEPEGNAPADPQGEFRNKNILYVARSIDDVSRLTGRTSDDVEAVLQRARSLLFDVRRRRPRPHLDDKVLTAWNGLMIAALARAARVVQGVVAGPTGAARRDVYLGAAQRAATFVKTSLWDASQERLLRRFRDGQASIAAYAEDYASLVWGLLELFQADGDPAWLEWALTLQRQQDALFWDAASGGWFSTKGDDPSVLLRLKDDHDGAEPGAGSIATLNLLTIAHLTGDGETTRKATRALERFGPKIGSITRMLPFMMCALAASHGGFSQIVLVGPQQDEGTTRLGAAIADRYLPFGIVVLVEPGPRQVELARLLPFVGAMEMRSGRPTVYICRDFTCREPVTDREAMASQLGES